MIIDSHAHYAHFKFDSEIPYLCRENAEWAVRRGTRESLFEEMKKQGIVGVIEPSIGFDNIKKQREIVIKHSDFMWSSLGVHPTRCPKTPWKNRKKVKEFAENDNIIAIGETGLDYHHPRAEQHRLRQLCWFIYHIKLADALELPLVLHIRLADRKALKVLQRFKKRLHSGVVHCFAGDHHLAEKYISLGFAIGIGGKLLCDDEAGKKLEDTVKNIPLSSILVETDAPFVFPDLDGLSLTGNQRKKMCNSSLILPAVIERIAELRGEPYKAVEDAIYQNTVRVFGLKITERTSNE